MSRHPVYTDTGCWIVCDKERRTNGHRLGTPQNNLGTPLGVLTPGLGTPALEPSSKGLMASSWDHFAILGRSASTGFPDWPTQTISFVDWQNTVWHLCLYVWIRVVVCKIIQPLFSMETSDAFIKWSSLVHPFRPLTKLIGSLISSYSSNGHESPNEIIILKNGNGKQSTVAEEK